MHLQKNTYTLLSNIHIKELLKQVDTSQFVILRRRQNHIRPTITTS